MNPVPIVVAALCLGPAAELKLKTHDWTQFRGPTRTGVSAETGLLKEWPKDGPPKVWTVTGCGQGYSTVSVAGGVVFGTGRMKDGQEHVWARDEATRSVARRRSHAERGNEGAAGVDTPPGLRHSPRSADGPEVTQA